MRWLLILVFACKGADTKPPPNLVEARKGFHSTLIAAAGRHAPPGEPPAGVMRLVKYDAPPGKLSAYVSPDPGDGKKHPAIVWITGGDCNSIGDVWSPADPSNDQTAAQYREAGLVMMYPSLRGGNDNPGRKEGFLGEVDDVLAATDYLARQSYVDPQHVYLGGHSTGGTLALLVAAAAPAGRYTAVFAFGAVDRVEGYGTPNQFCPFDMTNPKELELRAPIKWLAAIQTPTYALEGYGGGNMSNIESLRELANSTKNPRVTSIEVKNADHFSVLAPVNKLIAGKLAAGSFELTADEVNRAFQ